MNKEEIIGNWNIVKGKVKEQWSELTDDELLNIEGKKDQLIGAIQKKYGVDKEQAERQYSKFEKTLDRDQSKTDSCCS
ncbi:MAG: CsbD family protein [Ignavibacteria bacterium]|nr:CsbD family protein [Ignavibacteria bacterium]